MNTTRGILVVSHGTPDRAGTALILRVLRRPTRCHACGWFGRFFPSTFNDAGQKTHEWRQAIFGRELHLLCWNAGGAGVDTMLLERTTNN